METYGMLPQPIQSPHAQAVLQALQTQGTSNDCGPYTTATVLNALHGLSIEAAELAARMNRPVWRGPRLVVRRVPNWATLPWGMVDVFRSYGIQASWRLFGSPEYLYEVLPQTGRLLMPIIGAWRPLWAHVMALIAWDPHQGWGFANTQFDHRQIHWVPDQTFRQQWRAMGKLIVEVKHA